MNEKHAKTIPNVGEHRLSRRAAMIAGGAGVAANLGAIGKAAAHAATPEATPATTATQDWQAFDSAVETAAAAMNVVGTAIVVVDRTGIVHSTMFGVRDLTTNAPVTEETHFSVASTTKSMTSLMVATHVDEGLFGWDDLVHEVWPGFRAPSDELTATMRVRDLIGMDSGIGEPEAVSSFHQGDPTAGELLQLIVNFPVDNPPQTTFFYNNTVYAVGGYLPALAEGVAISDLGTAYASMMNGRVYGAAGMVTARIADDPRPYFDNYARGHEVDFLEGYLPRPWPPVGSFAPVGGTVATVTDMANYVAMQLNKGVAVDGTRVVSEVNLAECWKPHVDIPTSPDFDPDLTHAGYGMGWIHQTYRDGRSLTWHNGGIDGFTSFIGFMPDDDLGFVVLSNLGPLAGGLYFYPYVTNLLLGSRFGFNEGVNDKILAQVQAAAKTTQDTAAQATAVDPTAIEPFLGFYERGHGLSFDAAGALRLRQSARSIRLMAMPGGSYVMAGGYLAGLPVIFSIDDDGQRWMEVKGIETVRWSSGPGLE